MNGEKIAGSAIAIAEMAHLLDGYCADTAQHSARVGHLAVAVGKRLGLSDRRCNLLYLATMLHDIGKVHVRPELIKKKGKLTEDEYREVKQHTLYGEKMVLAWGLPSLVADIIGQHHERIDGSGYPRGLKEPQIRTESKIAAVVDVFDAMTCDRPYRHAPGAEMAAAELSRGLGVQFDGPTVEALLGEVEANRAVMTCRKDYLEKTRQPLFGVMAL